MASQNVKGTPSGGKRGSTNAAADATSRGRSKVSAQNAKQMPASVQYAIIRILPNIVNGCFWGFADMNDVQKHFAVLQQDNNIIARKLGNACILEVKQDYFLKAVQVIDPNAITNKDIQVMQQAIAEANIGFERFLISKGKQKNGFGGTIGIYCVNDCTSITYKGVSYPAFRLTMGDTLSYLNTYGYKVQVMGKFVDAMTAANAGQALWDSVQLSPTKTGVFVNIKSTYPPEQMKELEKLFKQKYNLK